MRFMYIGQALWCHSVAQFCFQIDTTETFSRALLSTCGSKVGHLPLILMFVCSVRYFHHVSGNIWKHYTYDNIIHMMPKKLEAGNAIRAHLA